MKYKNIFLIIITLLLICSCKSSKENTLDRVKYTNKSQIKNENLYGCWKYVAFDVYEEGKLIYESKFKATINFSENKLEYCLLYENKDYQCEKHEYKIDGNNLIVEDHGDLLNERYNVSLFEDENLPLLSLATVYKNQDYIFHLEYSKDCKIN